VLSYKVTEEQRYLFDLRGYVVIPNALTPEQLQRAKEAVDTRLSISPEWLEGSTSCRMGYPTTHFSEHDANGAGGVFRDLIDNPTVLPMVREAIGQEKVRLDHDYLDLIQPPASPETAGGGPIGTRLHGGNVPYDPGQFYLNRQGRMYNGLVVVAYNLADVNEGDGGFGCVPGSHKVNFNLPERWRDSGVAMNEGVAVSVPAPAGSAIIFTEALTHGTLPWRGGHQRRTLFYKYHQVREISQSRHALSWRSSDISVYVAPFRQPMMAWLDYSDTGYSTLQQQESTRRNAEWLSLLDPPRIGRA
jgi:ectoine hydroxylase-related dioxygenase (phytanoyl-CoA dioxygenase family)